MLHEAIKPPPQPHEGLPARALATRTTPLGAGPADPPPNSVPVNLGPSRKKLQDLGILPEDGPPEPTTPGATPPAASGGPPSSPPPPSANTPPPNTPPQQNANGSQQAKGGNNDDEFISDDDPLPRPSATRPTVKPSPLPQRPRSGEPASASSVDTGTGDTVISVRNPDGTRTVTTTSDGHTTVEIHGTPTPLPKEATVTPQPAPKPSGKKSIPGKDDDDLLVGD